ncbi:MAG: phytanoyl-CoA dioxygenase family protein [Streptosporangiaceae bacterium]
MTDIAAAAQLRPSTDVAGDPAELRRRLGEDGYLFFPALLERHRVAEAARDAMAVMADQGWLVPGSGPGEAMPRAPLPAIYGPEWRVLYVAVHGLESLHRLGFDPGLQSSLATLMGPDVFVLPRRIVRLVGPASAGGPEIGVQPHRDYEGFRIPDMLISWIPLVECSAGSGALWVCRGSHRDGMAPCPPFTPGDARWQTASYRPGDVLVLHCYSAHASAPNTGERFRLSIDFRWQRASYPVQRSMLDSDVNIDWSVLAGDWRTRRWISVPDGITLTDDGPGWEEVRDCPPSELFPVRRHHPVFRWRLPRRQA